MQAHTCQNSEVQKVFKNSTSLLKKYPKYLFFSIILQIVTIKNRSKVLRRSVVKYSEGVKNTVNQKMKNQKQNFNFHILYLVEY